VQIAQSAIKNARSKDCLQSPSGKSAHIVTMNFSTGRPQRQ